MSDTPEQNDQEQLDFPEEAEAPKPATRKRTTRKKAVAESPSEGMEAPKPKRKRATTKKAADAGDSGSDAEAAEEKKPAKRRTTRAKKADTAAAEAEEEAAPKKTTRRKSTKSTKSSKAEDADAASVASMPAADKATAGKEASAEEPASPSEPSEIEAPKEEKPRRKPRKRAASSAEPTEPAATDAGKQEEAESASSESEGSKPGSARKGAEKAEQKEKAKAKDSDSNAGGQGRTRRDRQNRGSNNQNGGQGNGRNRRNKRNKQREVAPSTTIEELSELKVAELRERAALYDISATGMKKADIVPLLFTAICRAEGFYAVSGILDILADGYGFLRSKGYLPSENDVYVGTNLIRRNNLRKGDLVAGITRPSRENEKFAALNKVESINGVPVAEMSDRVKFSQLTPIYPDERLVMEHGKDSITSRVIDITSPIGKGQRGLIVSPPKAGKTTILKDIAASISANNPEVHLMCLLVDERPEEVTDMERSIHGEVISSTFDMPCENHIAVAEMVIERAKRLVEMGEDVVILLDSITRLARAYNLAQPASGRILSGGVDSTALYPPKRFLGAARNIEFGGSLTILASALIDTGSKMDEVIFEEFKGTGNMELKLDRNMADRRIFPAIDVVASGTRKEDLLINPQEAPLIWGLRRMLANMNNPERATDMLIKSLKQTRNNQEFLIRTAKKAHS